MITLKSLNEADLIKELGEGISLVFFWSSWCSPCVDVKTLKELQQLSSEIKIGRVNVEENPDLSDAYSILMVPTYIFFKNGNPIKRLHGLQTKTALHKVVKALL